MPLDFLARLRRTDLGTSIEAACRCRCGPAAPGLLHGQGQENQTARADPVARLADHKTPAKFIDFVEAPDAKSVCTVTVAPWLGTHGAI
jgi:hypothetical protein